MEHTEANPCAVIPFFRVFGVFRGSLFSAPRTPQIRNPYRAGTAPGVLSVSFFNHGTDGTHGSESLRGYAFLPCFRCIPWFPVFGS